ncbi:GLE1-like protein-domain-containing protein [Hysterangium stoloniferum]|nr:GLE1-like protein-domain-containing protein [Hysterangium stoloniferum]
MRFGVSRSPSPEGRTSKPRGRFSYGLNVYDTSDEDEAPDAPGSSSSASDSPFCDSDSDARNRSTNTNRFKLPDQRQREIEETITSFRRAGEYEDPFKKWAIETRTAAFRAAAKRYESNPASTVAARNREIELRDRRIKESYARECDEVTRELEAFSLRHKEVEKKLVSDYKERERLLWQRIDGAIKAEEAKERQRLEAEEKAKREEAERLRQEEERKKAEEERKKEEEKERLLKAELEKKRKEKEEAEAKERADADAKKAAEDVELSAVRRDAGCRTVREDWGDARATLQQVKRIYLPTVKSNDTLRSIHTKGRRSIVPKIGQLTNSRKEIQRITDTILGVIHVQPPHPQPLYMSVLSSLAKAILMQAETEVSARAVTAIPLAQVTVHLLTHVPDFSEVLYARMVQRTGGWAVPVTVPKPSDMTELEYKKLRGYRTEREPQKDFETRVVGVMTLYFAILTTDVANPMPNPWSFPRFWTYLARLISTTALMRSDLAVAIFTVALQVGGIHAKHAYGIQFVKMLALLHGAIQETESSPPGQANVRQVGAEGVEGKPGRIRLLLEIEQVM